MLGAPTNPRPAIRLVILDIGGTLIEDHGDVPGLLRSALSNHGVESTPEEISKWRGASKREIIRHFVSQQSFPPTVNREKVIAAAYDQFTAELIEVYRSVPPVPGAEDAIRQLRQRGYLVATTTGFDRVVTESIFKRLGWTKYFAATICSDDVTQGRPAPFMLFHAMEAANVDNVAQVIAVGDTPLDLQAGTNAGMRAVVGVLTGAATIDKLRPEPHTHIVESIANVPSLLASSL
ncbi:MAG: putative hydrolase [Bryobacterales bacterium]|nr:putative hydrolase [Bryobacterales bacterium]